MGRIPRPAFRIPHSTTSGIDGWVYRLAVGSALLLPFETVRPVLRFPGFAVTSLELGIDVAVGVWLLHGFGRLCRLGLRAAAEFYRSLYGPFIPALGAFLSAAVLSALTAPAFRWESLKFVSRLVRGVCVFLMAVEMARDRRRAAGLLAAVVLGAGVSGVLGVGEMLTSGGLDPVLAYFKEAPSWVGGRRRLSGTFSFATIAAMFFEMTVPLAVAVGVADSRRVVRGVAQVAAVVGTVAVGLTLSRAGLLVLGAVVGGMLFGSRRVLGDRRTARTAGVVLGTLVLTVGGLLADPVFRLRIQSEGEGGWYGSRYIVPAVLDVGAGETVSVAVTVQNTGRIRWRARGERPFVLEYRWLSGDGRWVVGWPPTEVPIPADVKPGEVLRMDVAVPVRVPPGEYRIAWDMAIRGLMGFRHRGVPEAETAVRVRPGLGPADFEPWTHRRRDAEARILPAVSRIDLWRAAGRMWAERPFLGVGPDNFRRLYGRYLGRTEWDRRTHANSLYAELLADLGLVGAAAFGWVVGAVGVRWVRMMGRVCRGSGPGSADPLGPWAMGLGGSLLAFFLHGGADVFIAFTPVYALFGWVLGLTAGLGMEDGAPTGNDPAGRTC